MQLDEESGTLSPLPEVLSHGLVAVSFFGFLSFFCSTLLLVYLTWRMISWKQKSGSGVQMNQFLFLVYNLLFADIQQSIAFLLNASALSNNAIVVESPTCFAQGWFVSTGDLSSSVFICAIAIHTFMSVVKEYRLPESLFYGWIGSLWAFIYLMAILGPAMHGRDFYVRASAWVRLHSHHSRDYPLTFCSAGSMMPMNTSVFGCTTSGSSSASSAPCSSTLLSSSRSARAPARQNSAPTSTGRRR
jgi:hypothetical protein